MTIRSRSLAAGLLTLGVVGWIALIVFDLTRPPTPTTTLGVTPILGPYMPAALHVLTIGVLCTITLGGCVWLGILHLDRRHDAGEESRVAAIAELKHHVDARFHQADARAEHDTVEVHYQIAALPLARGTVHMSAAADTTPHTAANRRRRKNPGKRPGEAAASSQAAIPQQYLEDMSEAVQLGKRIEAEKRRRHTTDPDAAA